MVVACLVPSKLVRFFFLLKKTTKSCLQMCKSKGKWFHSCEMRKGVFIQTVIECLWLTDQSRLATGTSHLQKASFSDAYSMYTWEFAQLPRKCDRSIKYDHHKKKPKPPTQVSFVSWMEKIWFVREFWSKVAVPDSTSLKHIKVAAFWYRKKIPWTPTLPKEKGQGRLWVCLGFFVWVWGFF